jgi:hypothetical protein
VLGQDARYIEQRLGAIERSNRRWKFAGISLGLGLLIITSVAADKPLGDQIPDVIYARKFVAVNERNEPVAFMGHEKNAGMVSIAAPDGTLLFAASTTESGHGIVTTFDRKGRALVCLSATHSGDGHVAVYDDRGEETAQQPDSSSVRSVQPVTSRSRPASR